MTTLLLTHVVGNDQPVKYMMDLIILVPNAHYLRLNYIYKAENVFITVLNYQLSVQMHHARHAL